MMIQGRSFSGRERNCCFLNTLANPTSRGRFANISAASGLDFPDDGRAVSVVDWDHDGDLDLWMSNRNGPRLRLLRNNATSGNRFLAVRLSGNGETANRDAIGGRVEVVTKGEGRRENGEKSNNPQSAIRNPKLIKTLRAGEGYLAQSSKWLHFGLGTANEIDKVIVHWPGGEQETFTGLNVNGRYHLVQGSGKAVDSQRSRNDLEIHSSTPKLPPTASTARIPLVSLFPLPREDYRGLDGGQKVLPLGRRLLINLWSASCRPCLAELREFTEREKEVRAAGIEIIALSVDQLADDLADPTAVTLLVSKLAFPFPAGFTSPELLNLLQMFHDTIVPLERPLPLPSSFLLDAKGRLTVIYKGPVSVDQLLADAQHNDDTLFERRRRAALLPGRFLEDETFLRLARMQQSRKLLRMAGALEHVDRIFDVITHYEEALRIRPENVEARVGLGVALLRLDRHEDSIAHFKEALRFKPDLTGAHHNWAVALEHQGHLKEAMVHYQEALRIKPDNAKAHNNLGVVLDRLGRHQESIAHLKEALRIKPDLVDVHSNWAIVLKRLGRFEEAVAHYKEALRARPSFVAHINCGDALTALKRFEEALGHYREALRFRPKHAETQNSCGIALHNLGRDKESIKHFREAVQIDPNFAKAHYNLAWLQATCPDATVRDGRQALAHAKSAHQLTGGKVPAVLETLSAAYAELKDFEKAVQWQEKAVRIAHEKQKDKLITRLKLYEKGQPYHESK